MKRLPPVLGCLSVMRANHAVEPLTERTMWLLRCFYLNMLYFNCYVFILSCILCKVETFIRSDL